jgi:hypothetical protein
MVKSERLQWDRHGVHVQKIKIQNFGEETFFDDGDLKDQEYEISSMRVMKSWRL